MNRYPLLPERVAPPKTNVRVINIMYSPTRTIENLDGRGQQKTRKALAFILVFLLAILLLNFTQFFVGFTASDDGTYILSARQWIADLSYKPPHHWGFRYPVIFSLALLETVVEEPSEWMYMVVPFTFCLLLGIVLVWFLWANYGNRAATAGALLFGTMPLVVVQSSIINCDVIETLGLFVSVICFYYGVQSYSFRRALLLFASGLALSMALINRETAYGFLLVYGLLFLRGAYLPRLTYLWGFAGVMSLLAVEWIYYLSLGEPLLYRYLTISRSYGTNDVGPDHFGGDIGNITYGPVLSPIFALLANQEFMLLFYFSVGGAIWIWRSEATTDREKILLRLLLFSGLVYFLWLGYGRVIVHLPRYFLFIALLAIIPISIYFAGARRRWLAIVSLVVLVLSNYLGLMVENVHPRFVTKTLIAYAQKVGRPIAADNLTASRVERMADVMRIPRRRVILSEFPDNDTVLFARIEGRSAGKSEGESAWRSAYEAQHAKLVHDVKPPKLPIGWILDITGLGALLSEDQYRWLSFRNPEVRVYEVSLVNL